MVKKKKVEEKKVDKCGACSLHNWSGKDWFSALISEVALYFFFYYGLSILGASGNPYVSSLILLVLIHVTFFMCPVMKQHCH